MMFKKSNGGKSEMKGPAPSEEAVLEFIKNNPRPKDKQFHAWAKSKGVNVHKAEATSYGILSDLVHKGRSKGKHPAGISKGDVREGVKIEAEHTPNKILRRKITDDHNAELKKYYDKKKGLPKMEKDLEKDGGIGRVVGRSKYRLEQMQKEKGKTTTKSKVESPSDLMAFLRSKGHRVSSSQPLEAVEKKAGDAFIDELTKISSSIASRSGKWIGRKLSGISSAPGEFISSVRKGYKGAPPAKSTGPIYTPGAKNVAGGDPQIAAMVKRTMIAKKQSAVASAAARKSKLQAAPTVTLKPPFPSQKVKLKSSGTSSVATRALIK